MKQKLLLLMLFAASYACAETIVLHTGARVKGTIVFQNDEVVILRDADGARSQYLRSDISELLSDDLPEPQQDPEPEPEPETSKHVSILLEMAGGAAVQPGDTAGGAFSVDFLIGSHQLAARHLFVGAGLGYHGFFMGDGKYNFLPVQVAVRMPLTERRHAPQFGLSVGYGIALSKNYLGGLYAGLDFGYRCQFSPRSAVALTAYASFQQARLTTVERIPDGAGATDAFTASVGRSLVAAGIRLSLYF